ncbi:unnamed protein product [Lota lota]
MPCAHPWQQRRMRLLRYFNVDGSERMWRLIPLNKHNLAAGFGTLSFCWLGSAYIAILMRREKEQSWNVVLHGPVALRTGELWKAQMSAVDPNRSRRGVMCSNNEHIIIIIITIIITVKPDAMSALDHKHPALLPTACPPPKLFVLYPQKTFVPPP